MKMREHELHKSCICSGLCKHHCGDISGLISRHTSSSLTIDVYVTGHIKMIVGRVKVLSIKGKIDHKTDDLCTSIDKYSGYIGYAITFE